MGLPRLRLWMLGVRIKWGQAGQTAEGQAGSLEGALVAQLLSHLHFENKGLMSN